MPRLTEVRVFDNSSPADPHAGRVPQPILILHLATGRIVQTIGLPETPQWARPLVAAAVKIST
jgi:hypothetical protein